MQNQLLDHLLQRHRQPNEADAAVLERFRHADQQLSALYRCSDVQAADGYADPLVRAAYLLRYLPHYTLQCGDMLRELEGDPEVAALFCRPQLRHAAFCGGPAPEPIALAVLHAQAGGQHLHSLVFDRQVDDWSDCWPISASTAQAFSGHPCVRIEGQRSDLAQLPEAQELAWLGRCQLFSLMNALNELMLIGQERLQRNLDARLAALPAGALVLVSDQARYNRCERGMQMLQAVLESRGARLLISRTCRTDELSMGNRFQLDPRLRRIYSRSGLDGGPPTAHHRIWNHQLQLVAVLPG